MRTFTHQIIALAALAATFPGCTVESDVRCNFGATPCPETFYCGGEWCYPEGTGPRIDEGVDMTPDMPDMRVADPDMRVADPDMLVADPDMRVADPDMRVADPDMRVADPDMRVADPDMRVADPDMAPDMAPPTPQFRLEALDPANGILSPVRPTLRATLRSDAHAGPFTFGVGIFELEDGQDPNVPPAPDTCGPAAIDRMVQFVDGLAALDFTLPELRNQANPMQICISDPQPGGSTVAFIARIDEEPPVLRIDPFETHASRTAGTLPVEVSEDVALDRVRLYAGDDCQVEYIDDLQRMEDESTVRFTLTGLAPGSLIPVSVGATDPGGNTTCTNVGLQLDRPPELENAPIICRVGDAVQIELQIADDGEDMVLVEFDNETHTCPDVNIVEEHSLQFDCSVNCTLGLTLNDGVGPATTTLPVVARNRGRFSVPQVLSYNPGEVTRSLRPLGAVLTRRTGADGPVDVMIVTGGPAGSQRMAHWYPGPSGLESATPLALPGLPVEGELTGAEGLELFVGNVEANNGGLFRIGCAVTLFAANPILLNAAGASMQPVCAEQDGNQLVRAYTGRFDADEYDDVVGLDNLGRAFLWRGGADALQAAVQLGDRAGANDVGIITAMPGVHGRIILTYPNPDGNMLDAISFDGTVEDDVLVAHDLLRPQAQCVTPVDWDNDGTDEIALCDNGAVVIGHLINQNFVELARLPGTADLNIVDLAFDRSDVIAPDAIMVSATGDVYMHSAGDTIRIEMPESIVRLIELRPARPGIAVGLVPETSSRLYRLDDHAAYHGFEERSFPLPAALQTARPTIAGDVTGDGVTDLGFLPTNATPATFGDVVSGWRTHQLIGRERGLDERLAIGDRNADGRTEPVLYQRNSLPGRPGTLRSGLSHNPQTPQQVPLNQSIDLDDELAMVWGMTIGHMPPEGPGDIILLGLNTMLQPYRASGPLGSLEALDPINLPAAGQQVVIADVDNAPAAVVATEDGQQFTLAAYRLDGQPVGDVSVVQSRLISMRVANINGVRRVIVLTRAGAAEALSLWSPDGLSLVHMGPIDQFAVGDVNGDLQADLVIVDPDRGRGRGPSVCTLLQQGDAFVEVQDETFTAEEREVIDGVFVGDFDGDRRPDRLIVVTDPDARTRRVVLLGYTAQ